VAALELDHDNIPALSSLLQQLRDF